jgi:tetratricopeptide (TPR) repeat protein
LSGATRRSLLAVGAALALLALVAQLIADGLYGSRAQAPSVPSALAGDWPFDLAARTGLDRLPLVRRELARGAIVRGEGPRATALLAPLSDSPEVVDLRGRAAMLENDPAAALHDFAAAGDFIAAQGAIDALGTHDPRAALALVRDFESRLAAAGSAPEIAAEVEWREGQIAAAAAVRYPAQAAPYQRAAVDAFARALARAPNDEKYLLNYAFAALRIGDAEGARRTYERAAQVVPDSVDAFVGVAVTAADLGDCAASRAALARARQFAGVQHRAADAAAAGYGPDVRAALARCNG